MFNESYLTRVIQYIFNVWSGIHCEGPYPAVFTGIPLPFHKIPPDVHSRNNCFPGFPATLASNLPDIHVDILAFTENLPKQQEIHCLFDIHCWKSSTVLLEVQLISHGNPQENYLTVNYF